MNAILIYISEVLINFIEAGLFVYLISKKLVPKERYAGRIKSINIIWIMMLVIIIIIVNILKINGVGGFLIFLILQLLFTLWLMEAQAAEKILWSGIYITVDLSADVLAYFVTSMLTLGQSVTVDKYQHRFLVTWIYAVLLIIYIFMLCRLKKRELTLPKWSVYAFTVFIVSGIIAVQAVLDYSIEYSYMLSKSQVYGIYAIMMLVIAAIAIFIVVFISFGGVSQEKEVLKQENKLLEEKIEQVSDDPVYFSFKVQGMTHKINLKEVKYMNSDLRLANITMLTGEKHAFYGELDELFKDANELYPYFLRTGKSYAVNTFCITGYTKNSLFIDGMEFRISGKYLNSFRATFN